MNEIRKYFPGLSEIQIKQINALYPLYKEWNEKINVISRKDMDNFYTHHVLHSLTIGHYFRFSAGTSIIDIGTGGGFPGIPLAILFPECKFLLVDSTGKKIKVVNAVSESLKLNNVNAVHERAEKINASFDFVVSRAVTNLEDFVKLTKNKINPESKNDFKNGIIYLKGGDVSKELQNINKQYKVINLSSYFDEEYFNTKVIVYLY